MKETIYSEGISPEWVDVPVLEQVDYLAELRLRWKTYVGDDEKKINHDAWAIPRVLMQKENDIRAFHHLSRRGQKTLYTNNGWVWNTGAQLPIALRLLRGFDLSVFKTGTEIDTPLLFDHLDIQTSLFIGNETLAKIKAMPVHRNFLSVIGEQASQKVYLVMELTESLELSQYPEWGN